MFYSRYLGYNTETGEMAQQLKTLLFQRIQVQFPGPTQKLTSLTSVPGDPMPYSDICHTAHTHALTCRQNRRNKMKNKLSVVELTFNRSTWKAEASGSL